jgi:hypothetical protein
MTSLSVESPYSQAPLDLTRSTFRLVELQPCSPTELIKCHLTTHALPPDCPPFVALSYTWDHISPKDTIELSGTPFLVGHSLWTFLDEMRSQKKFQTYWIDAICIDQSNVQERNHQVQLMKVIYSQAESISIWLGPVEEGSLCVEAVEFLRDVYDWLVCKGFMTFLRGEPGIEIDTIIALCQNKYWERMWIFQEVVLARVATIYFGPWTIRIDDFYSMVSILKHGDILETPCTTYDGTKRAGLSVVIDLLTYRAVKARETKSSKSLDYAMRYCMNRKATDVRDRIYGLLGVMEEELSWLEVDYQIIPMDLWTKILAYFCRKRPVESIYRLSSSEYLGWLVAEALELDISKKTIREFIKTQDALYGEPSELSDSEGEDFCQ